MNSGGRPISSQTEHLSTIQDIGADSSDEETEHFNYGEKQLKPPRSISQPAREEVNEAVMKDQGF